MHSIEHLESRIAPASLIGRVLSYTDIDGDKVTVAFSKGLLSADNFVFNNTFDTVGAQQLQRIDIAGEPEFEGGNITVKVVKSPGGDGVAHIGEIIATGRDVGVVKTKGDVGKIVAGNSTFPAPAIKSLTIGSYGIFDGTTQPAGSNQSGPIAGDVPNLTILGDFGGGAMNVSGAITNLKIGGSVVGGLASEGRIIVQGDVARIVVGGSFIGGPGNQSASLTVAGNVDSIKILGSVYGGSSEQDTFSGQINISGSVGKFVIGNDVRAANGVGKHRTIVVGGTVGSFMVGGDITAPEGEQATIFLADTVDVPGTAVGRITVGGTVENAVIGAGADLDRPVTLDRLTISGSFIKSSIVVGTGSGPDLMFGTGDDVINAASRLNTLVIKRTVFGTVMNGMDTYFIEAGRIGSVTLGGRPIPVTAGGDMVTASLSGDVFIRDLV